MDTFVSILLFILIFGVIVLVHELGHYLLAKANGITVVEFFIGMGPTLCSFTKNGTKYSIKLLPIGGACMFEGEDGMDLETAKKNQEKIASSKSEVDEKEEKLRESEELKLRKDVKKSGAFPDANIWARIATVFAGPFFNIILAMIFAMIMLGVTGSIKPVVKEVMEGYPAKEAGLNAGDVITSVNGKKVYIYQEVQLKMAMNRDGEPVKVTFLHEGTPKEATIVPKYNEGSGSYLMGISGGEYFEPKGLELFSYGYYEVRYCVGYTLDSLKMLVTGKAGLNDMAGPVGMAQVVDDTYTEAKAYGTKSVVASMLNIALLLSVNLGILNLLPLPALDGGRLFFMLIELIRRKPIPPEKEGIVHFAGFVALMLLMAVVFFNDIMKLIEKIVA